MGAWFEGTGGQVHGLGGQFEATGYRLQAYLAELVLVIPGQT